MRFRQACRSTCRDDIGSAHYGRLIFRSGACDFRPCRPQGVHGARHFTQSHGRPERSPERADAPEKRPDTTNLKVGIFKRWQHSKAFRNRTKRAPSRVPSQRGEGSRNSGWILYSSLYSRSMIFPFGPRPSPVSPYRLLSVPVSCCAVSLGPSFLLSVCVSSASLTPHLVSHSESLVLSSLQQLAFIRCLPIISDQLKQHSSIVDICFYTSDRCTTVMSILCLACS